MVSVFTKALPALYRIHCSIAITMAFTPVASYNTATKTYEFTHIITATETASVDFIRRELIGPKGGSIERLKNEVFSRTQTRPYVRLEDDRVVIKSSSKTTLTLCLHLIKQRELDITKVRPVVRQTYELKNTEHVGRIMGREGHRTKAICERFKVAISFDTLEGGRGTFLVSGESADAVSGAIAELRKSEEHIISQTSAEIIQVPLDPIDVTSILIPAQPVGIDVTPLFTGYAKAAKTAKAKATVKVAPASVVAAVEPEPTPAPAPAKVEPAPAPAAVEPTPTPAPAKVEPAKPKRVKVVDMIKPKEEKPFKALIPKLKTKSWADEMDELDSMSE